MHSTDRTHSTTSTSRTDRTQGHARHLESDAYCLQAHWALLHMPAQQPAVAVQLSATTNPAAGAWRVSYLMACCLMLVAGMPTASEPKPTSPSLTRPASRTKMRPASVTCGAQTHTNMTPGGCAAHRLPSGAWARLCTCGQRYQPCSVCCTRLLRLGSALCLLPLPDLCCVRTSPHTCPDASSACAASRLSTRAAWRARSLPIWWTTGQGTHMCVISNYRCSKLPHTSQPFATQSALVLHAALLHDVLPAR